MISAVICVLFRLIWHLYNLPCVFKSPSIVPHGEQTIDEMEFFSSRWRDRSARNTSASIGNVFPFLCGAVKMFTVCYLLSIQFKISCKLCFKTTNTQSAIVRRCRFFWLSSSMWGRFFRCCLIHLTDFNLFRKQHVLYFTEKQKRSSFPNHHWTEWTKLTSCLRWQHSKFRAKIRHPEYQI